MDELRHFDRFWFLDAAVRLRTLVGHVLQHPKISSYRLWRPAHRIEKLSIIIELLLRYEEEGLIQFIEFVDTDERERQRRVVKPTLDLLNDEHHLYRDISTNRENRRSRLCYELTAEGGRQWELIAEPDWSRFWYDEYDEVDGVELIQISSGSAALFDRHMRSELPSILGLEMIEAMNQIDHVPWQATYWKLLPYGQTRVFSYRHAEYQGGRPSPEAFATRCWHRFGTNKTTCEQILPFD